MNKNSNALNWFEIPATNAARARKFYESIFSMTMEPMEMEGMAAMTMVAFPNDMGNGNVSGALVVSQFHKPSKEGVIVYLNADPSIQTILDRIPKAGGSIVMPRTVISAEIGVMAFFIDTEGNQVALHAQQ